MTNQRVRSVAVALVAVLAAACTGHHDPDASRTTTISGVPSSVRSSEPVPVKIAVFQDQSNEDPMQLVTPSYLGLQLSLTLGADGIPVVPQLMALDVNGDPARATELAHQVVEDPTVVAAVISPFWVETRSVGDILDAAGIPTISLSPLGPDLSGYGWSGWRRMVPTQPRQADSLAALLAGAANRETGICVVRDDSSYSTALAGLLKQRLKGLVAQTITITPGTGGSDSFGQAVAGIDSAACRTVAWTGFAASGALLRTSLSEAGLTGVVIYGADAVKDEPFLTLTGGAGNGTVVTCPCVDLATSTDPAAQRFVHDYQSEFGSSPGVYGAEGWDVGSTLLNAFVGGGVSRSTMVEALARVTREEGLAGTYTWTDSGELTPSSVQVHTFVDRGERWTPLATAPAIGPTALPLHTEGLLTAAACRSGEPFDAEVHGRPVGFDVDLLAAIAKNLGVRLGWQPITCDKARSELAVGKLDVLMTARDSLPQGTPASRVALSVRTALVTRRSSGGGTVLGALGPGDRVGVVSGPVTTPWIRSVLAGPGARVRAYRSADDAYAALVRGDIAAVADTEYGAWAGIERRRSLMVTQTFDAGAHDVLLTSGPGTEVLGAVDGALGHLLASGRYALLWTKWFPGTTVPAEVGK